MQLTDFVCDVCHTGRGGRHVLVLTRFGTVYSCGDNTEGALGTGDMISRSSLELILWQKQQQQASGSGGNSGSGGLSTTCRITSISAGSGSIGSHSLVHG